MKIFEAFFISYYAFVGALYLLIFLVVWLILKLRQKELKSAIVRWYLPVFSMSVVGLTVGLLAGNSRIPVVDVLVPAFLSLIGGFNVYLFSKKDQLRASASLISLVLALFLVIGIYAGSDNRDKREAFDRDWERALIQYNADMEIYKLRIIKNEDLPVK